MSHTIALIRFLKNANVPNLKIEGRNFAFLHRVLSQHTGMPLENKKGDTRYFRNNTTLSKKAEFLGISPVPKKTDGVSSIPLVSFVLREALHNYTLYSTRNKKTFEVGAMSIS